MREEGQLFEGAGEADCCRGRVGVHCGKSDSLKILFFFSLLLNYVLYCYVALSYVKILCCLVCFSDPTKTQAEKKHVCMYMYINICVHI